MCIETVIVNQGSTFAIMYRVMVDGDEMVQADVDTIEYAIYNDDTREAVLALTSLTVANVVFNTLQTDERWTVDTEGYNFRHDVSHSLLTDPDITYRIEYKITLDGGSEFYLNPVRVRLEEMYSA
jgi:hypothetical protein